MTHWLETLWQDVRLGARALARSPGFTATALVTLALGVGANTAIFGLINSVMLKSLPVVSPERLVVLDDGSWTNPIWEEIRDHQTAFDGVLAWGGIRPNLAERGESRFLRGLLTSGSYFDVLGVTPALGRVYHAEDDRRGCGDDGLVAVLGYGFWQAHFGGDPRAVGRSLRLDGRTFTILGVAPAEFHGARVGESFDVAMPLCAEPAFRGEDSALDKRSFWWLTILGRLAPGGSAERAQGALRVQQEDIRVRTMPTHWPPELQASYLEEPFTLSPAATGVSRLRDRYRQALVVLMGISGLVLLVACANIANLVLARATVRGRELALRSSVGASVRRLTRLLLVESLVLGLAGAAAGAALAHAASRLLVGQLSTARTPAFLDLSVDWRMLAFSSAAGLVTGALFGVYPALAAARRAPLDALRQSRAAASGPGGPLGAARLLVSVQVALSLVLVVGAALFAKSYAGLVQLDPGFDREGVLVVDVDTQAAGEDGAVRRVVEGDLLEALTAIPGVRSAAQAAITPISGRAWAEDIEVDGFVPRSEKDAIVYMNAVTPDYFRVLRAPVLRGRGIEAGDAPGAGRVAVVNETFAEKFFDGDAVGGTFRRRKDAATWEEVSVVGVVADAKYRSLREEVPPTAFEAYRQYDGPSPSAFYVLHLQVPVAAARDAVVGAAADVDPRLTLTFQTLQSQVDDSLVQERLLASLSALFGVLGVVLAAVGLAGLVAYAVSRRRSELSVRAALGATPRRLVATVLRDVALVTLLGVAVGSALSLAGGRLVSALLYGVGAGDVGTLLAAAGAVALVAGAAGWLPARRAARLEPGAWLKSE